MQTSADNTTLPDIASAQLPSDRQRLYIRYFTAVLIDLTILNLFAEYWDQVVVESFTFSLLAAVLLQVLLKLTLALEHRVGLWFSARPGTVTKVLRLFCVWLILFGSKFIMLGAIDLLFGDHIRFIGVAHGVFPFLVVVCAMLGAEELAARFFRSLNNQH